MHLAVRNCQFVGYDDLVVVKEQVEVDIARGPFFASASSSIRFDFKHCIQKLLGIERSLYTGDGVQKFRLVLWSERLGLDEFAGSDYRDSGIGDERIDRISDIGTSVAEVASQSDICGCLRSHVVLEPGKTFHCYFDVFGQSEGGKSEIAFACGAEAGAGSSDDVRFFEQIIEKVPTCHVVRSF